MIKQHYNYMRCLFIGLATISFATAIDNPHFYRANFFWGEPRFEKNWLTSWDFLISGGSTKKAFNCNGQKTALLNVFGLHAMQNLGADIPCLDEQNELDRILIDLNNLPCRDNFGKLLFKGDFSIVEAVINGYQNLCSGFFLQLYLPIRRLTIQNIQYCDKSPEDTIVPNKNSPEWIQFLGNFSQILARYGRSITNVHRMGIGDLTLLAGWTFNNQDTTYADYYDVTAKFGILFPTGKKRSLRNPFDLPLGYDGFYGMPLKFDCSMGYWEWLTCGAHIGALFLFDRSRCIAMKTAHDQNGFIFLTSGKALVDPGTIWDIAAYTKADHIFRGLSLLVGYCFTLKERDCIKPDTTNIFIPEIVNSDQRFRSWQMHVIHWFLEYDFAHEPSDIGPRIGFFYNWIIGGKRIFDTTMAVASVGIDIEWCF